MNNTIKIDGIEYNLVPVEKKVETHNFKVGDWVYYTKMQEVRSIINDHIYIDKTSRELDDIYGGWMSIAAVNSYSEQVKAATEEEIETHLIALAKKKGYDKVKRVKSVLTETIYHLNFKNMHYSTTYQSLNDGNVTIYKNGEWAEIVKEEEKKFTFGEQQVTIDKSNIICKGTIGTFKQLENIVNNPFILNHFGNACTSTLMTLNNTAHCTLTDNPIDIYKNLITCIKIGCLTGTYKELLDIYNHILELNKK